MSILALDLGTTTGWAMRGGELVHSGSQSFKPTRFEGGGMRYLKFSRWLDEVAGYDSARPCDLGLRWVVFEEVRRHRGVDAAHAYGGFMAHLTAWCESRRVPYQGVPVATIKNAVLGKGAGKGTGKEEMIAAVRKLGYSPADDNEADAIALLLWAIKENRNETAGDTGGRPAPDREPDRRVPVGAVPVARPRGRIGAR